MVDSLDHRPWFSLRSFVLVVFFFCVGTPVRAVAMPASVIGRAAHGCAFRGPTAAQSAAGAANHIRGKADRRSPDGATPVGQPVCAHLVGRCGGCVGPTVTLKSLVHGSGFDYGSTSASTTWREFVATESAPEYKKPVEGSGKDESSDAPSWVKNDPAGRPQVGESGKEFAERLLDKKYGEGNYGKGPGSEYSKIKSTANGRSNESRSVRGLPAARRQIRLV